MRKLLKIYLNNHKKFIYDFGISEEDLIFIDNEFIYYYLTTSIIK